MDFFIGGLAGLVAGLTGVFVSQFSLYLMEKHLLEERKD